VIAMSASMQGFMTRQRIIMRSIAYRLSNPSATRQQCDALAAREIAAEQRREQKQAKQQGTAAESNPLLARIESIFRNMRLWEEAKMQSLPRGFDRSSNDKQGVDGRMVRKVKPPQPDGGILGVWPTSMRAAVRPDDSEYLPRFHDHTTANWRRSISENQRIEAERKAAWAVRLAEIHKHDEQLQ
jgi:hypothetical protein